MLARTCPTSTSGLLALLSYVGKFEKIGEGFLDDVSAGALIQTMATAARRLAKQEAV